MRVRLFVALLALIPSCLLSSAWASESSWPMQSMTPDLENSPSLQNGFKLYVNYCIGCHSLQYQRYERTADDLGIPHEVALENLIFTGQKIGELMTSSMDPDKAKAWFGGPPPDLTLVTRVRSPEWVFNYLKTFYLDDSRPFGVNNGVFANVGMPNVLMHLQGVQELDCAPDTEACTNLAIREGSGILSTEEFDDVVYDLANFLYYVGEPSRLERQRLGVFVLLFLVVLFVVTNLLAREYRKEVRH
jgi:ubiquinol-cytochrome c reductase cytochrome b subunit